jgi:hypothetical protein
MRQFVKRIMNVYHLLLERAFTSPSHTTLVRTYQKTEEFSLGRTNYGHRKQIIGLQAVDQQINKMSTGLVKQMVERLCRGPKVL